MSKTRKFLLAVCSCVMAVATTLAVAVNFILPVKKGVAETVNVTVDFETNKGSFVCVAGSKWTASNGVYNATNWGEMYYDSAISTTATRVISFDMYLTEGAQPGFALVNKSKIYDDAGEKVVTKLAQKGMGIGFAFTNNTETKDTIRLTTCVTYSANDSMTSKSSLNLAQYYGKTSRVEITIVNKNVTFAIDGKVIFSAAEN